MDSYSSILYEVVKINVSIMINKYQFQEILIELDYLDIILALTRCFTTSSFLLNFKGTNGFYSLFPYIQFSFPIFWVLIFLQYTLSLGMQQLLIFYNYFLIESTYKSFLLSSLTLLMMLLKSSNDFISLGDYTVVLFTCCIESSPAILKLYLLLRL